MKKVALITGITGQDGSYLAELLLKKGYKVYGLIRRSSTETDSRIYHLRDKITLVQGDLLDQHSLDEAVREVQPDEVYNLAAQSFVPTSWNQPVLTGEFTAIGVIKVLEAIHHYGKKTTRFYQASSSEMFGKVQQVPQNEKTPLYPRSPYGVAKVYGHYITINYRESYGMFAVSGILFNHECVTANTPIIIRRNGFVDIIAIEEIVPHRENPRHGTKYTAAGNNDLEVWDGTGWTKIKTLTATWNKAGSSSDKKVTRVICRGGYYEATADHLSFLEGRKDIKTGKLKTGDRLELKSFPKLSEANILLNEEAELLGMMAADGYVSADGKGRFINNDQNLRKRTGELWRKIAAGTSKETEHPSGFNEEKNVKSVEFTGNRNYWRFIRSELYNEKLFKKIPQRVLNAKKEIILSFLKGYNACDGLKAGGQKTEFKCFTTNSPVLAAGLWYLTNEALKLRVTMHPEFRKNNTYFHLNVNSDNKNQKGKHLQRETKEIKLVKKTAYTGWLFDLETESGTFSAGIGPTWIHNSPRRGLEFVTRKITDAVARIKLGLADEVRLGNLEAKRDWGFAGDYVKAMWLMLQQNKPDDFVIGTGEAHSVREFCEIAFSRVGLDYKKYVKIDKKFWRPAEVEFLISDPSKAKKILGWKNEVSFRQLVEMMVDADMERVKSAKV